MIGWHLFHGYYLHFNSCVFQIMRFSDHNCLLHSSEGCIITMYIKPLAIYSIITYLNLSTYSLVIIVIIVIIICIINYFIIIISVSITNIIIKQYNFMFHLFMLFITGLAIIV